MARVTKREKFVNVLEVLADAGKTELAEFIAGEIVLIDKRAAAPRKETKEQRENVVLKAEFVTFLDEAGALRAGEVAKEFDITVQKATALLAQLVKAGEVKRVEGEKGVTRFVTV